MPILQMIKKLECWTNCSVHIYCEEQIVISIIKIQRTHCLGDVNKLQASEENMFLVN